LALKGGDKSFGETRKKCKQGEVKITTLFRYLRGLELMQVVKPVKEELGGGAREFTVKDVRKFCLNGQPGVKRT